MDGKIQIRKLDGGGTELAFEWAALVKLLVELLPVILPILLEIFAKDMPPEDQPAIRT